MDDEKNTLTILALDDEEDVLQALGIHLEGVPHNVVLTNSPEKALAVLSSENVALLICDFDLGRNDLDGNVILTAAREADPHTLSVLLTARASHADTIRAINEGGIWKFIQKPWRRAELLAVVEEGIERYRRVAVPEAPTVLTGGSAKITVRARGQGKVTVGRKKAASAKDGGKSIRVVKKREQRRSARRALKNLRVRGKGTAGDLVSRRYELGEILGEGGTGVVYKATDTMLGMEVAVKVLPSRLTRNSSAIKTLKEEARITMGLSHKNIVRLHNLQRSGDHYFMVMEYVEGRSVQQILNQYGPLTIGSAVQVIRVCSEAVAYAHKNGVLHCDLKPGNLLVTEDKELKIIDFGIACLMGSQEPDDIVEGTFQYMSPEQMRGEALDAATDIYSLGVITYQLLVGELPFHEEVEMEELIEMLPLDVSVLPESVRETVGRAIALNRIDRWPSVQAYSDALVEASGVEIPSVKA